MKFGCGLTRRIYMKRWELKREDLLQSEEWRKFRQYIDDRAILAKFRGSYTALQDKVICYFAVFSGLRRSEIAELRLGDLFLKNEMPFLVVRNGKGNKYREVLISNDCRSLLKGFIKIRRESMSDAVFIPQRGEKYTGDGIYRVWKTAIKEAGIAPRSIHKARHYNGMMLYSSSKDIRFVQRQLGHSRITTSQVYVDIVAEDAKENLENLDKALKV